MKHEVDSWAAQRRYKEQREQESRAKREEQEAIAKEEELTVAREQSEARSDGGKADVYVRRSYDATYRNKHKARINMQRRERDAEPINVYKKSKRRAKERKQDWALSYPNWKTVWDACPRIWCDRNGMYKYAWDMRSGNTQLGTQLRRKDPYKAWIVSNIEIIYRNQPIPAHGIVSPWDFKRDKPVLPRQLIEEIARDKQVTDSLKVHYNR